MNIILPNNNRLEGVPNDATKEQIKNRAIALGLATNADFVQASDSLWSTKTIDRINEIYNPHNDYNDYNLKPIPPVKKPARQGWGEVASKHILNNVFPWIGKRVLAEGAAILDGAPLIPSNDPHHRYNTNLKAINENLVQGEKDRPNGALYGDVTGAVAGFGAARGVASAGVKGAAKILSKGATSEKAVGKISAIKNIGKSLGLSTTVGALQGAAMNEKDPIQGSLIGGSFALGGEALGIGSKAALTTYWPLIKKIVQIKRLTAGDPTVVPTILKDIGKKSRKSASASTKKSTRQSMIDEGLTPASGREKIEGAPGYKAVKPSPIKETINFRVPQGPNIVYNPSTPLKVKKPPISEPPTVIPKKGQKLPTTSNAMLIKNKQMDNYLEGLNKIKNLRKNLQKLKKTDGSYEEALQSYKAAVRDQKNQSILDEIRSRGANKNIKEINPVSSTSTKTPIMDKIIENKRKVTPLEIDNTGLGSAASGKSLDNQAKGHILSMNKKLRGLTDKYKFNQYQKALEQMEDNYAKGNYQAVIDTSKVMSRNKSIPYTQKEMKEFEKRNAIEVSKEQAKLTPKQKQLQDLKIKRKMEMLNKIKKGI